MDDDDNNSRDEDYKPSLNGDSSSKDEDKQITTPNTHGGNTALKSLLGAVDDDFFDDNDSNSDHGNPDNSGSPVRRGRPKTSNFPKKKPSAGARSEDTILVVYEKERKGYYDEQRIKKLMSRQKRPVTDFTGNHHPMLRTMGEVEKFRLSKGQTFKSRNVLILRTKEEANLRGVSIKASRWRSQTCFALFAGVQSAILCCDCFPVYD